MRKVMNVGLCSMAALLLLTGCSNNSSNTAGDTTSQSESTQGEEGTTEETEEYVAESSITLGNYKGIPVSVSKVQVSPEEVDAQIQRVLEQKAEFVEKDKAAADGDQVNINYKGLLDGEAFEGGTAEEYLLVLGSNSFIDGFEDGLIDVKKGEKRDLDLTFPETYGNKELAGKAVVFEVTVNSVMEKKVPELTDAFVKELAPDLGTVDKYRQSVEESIFTQKQQQINNKMDMDILDAIMDSSEIICSTDDVDKEYEEQMQYHTETAAMYGVDINTYAMLSGMDEGSFQKEIRNQARELTKQKMVIKAIAEQENITVTDEDRIKLGKESYYGSLDALLSAVGQDKVDEAVIIDKTLNYLAEQAVVTTIESDAEPVSEDGTEAETETADVE